jgi:AraC-like DNA-binding protein
MTGFYREERFPRGNIRNIYDCSAQKTIGKAPVAQPHIHEFYEILYCQSGAYTLLLNEKPYSLYPGDMALIDPMAIHETRALCDQLNQYLVIKFMPEVLYSTEQLMLELKYFLPFIKGSGSHQKVFPAEQTKEAGVGDILQEIVDEYLRRDFGYEIALRANIIRLFLWILRCWHKDRKEAMPDKESLEILSNALQYVDENYAQGISMADAAKYCHMPYTAFSRFFSRYLGRGFTQYLLLIRLKKASMLLAQTDKSVTDIAMETGFSTTSYFIQRFKENQGMTPKHFRKWFDLKG